MRQGRSRSPLPRTLTEGRPSPPVKAILRMLVVKHLYSWSYEQTESWVGDRLVLRQFCRVYAECVSDDTTVLRWANTIQPTTLHHLLEHVVDLACRHHVTRGRKLRVDSMGSRSATGGVAASREMLTGEA